MAYVYGYTIYRHPPDFPRHFVVRAWRAAAPTRIEHAVVACLCDTLREARQQIPEGLDKIGRQPEDDPVVVETWI